MYEYTYLYNDPTAYPSHPIFFRYMYSGRPLVSGQALVQLLTVYTTPVKVENNLKPYHSFHQSIRPKKK